MAFILKVLSGPHIGAEVLLKPGEYILGSGEESDLIFCDVSVSPEHARLKLTETGMSVQPLGSKVCLNGNEVMEDEISFDFNQVISLGTIHFGLIPENGAWSEIALPSFANTSNGKRPQSSDGRNDSVAEAQLNGEGDFNLHSSASPSSRQPGQIKKGLWISIVSVLIVFILVAVLLISQLVGSHETVSPKLDKLQRLRALLDRLQMDSIAIDAARPDGIKIKGYLETNEQKLGLIRELQLNSLNLPMDIWTNEQMVALADEVVKNYGLELKVADNGLGVLKLKGCLDTKEELSTLLANLQRDIPAIVRIEAEVETVEEAAPEMAEILRTSQLGRKLRISALDGSVGLAGEIPAHEMENWQSARKQFLDRYGPCIPLKENFTVRESETDDVDSDGDAGSTTPAQSTASGKPEQSESPGQFNLSVKLTAVALGEVKFVMNENGRTFTLGEELEEGHIIEEIERYRILLRKGNEKTWVPLDSLPIYLEY